MRTIQTYILRLLIDTEDWPNLRGALQGVANGENYPFSDEQALLALLHQLISTPEPPNETNR